MATGVIKVALRQAGQRTEHPDKQDSSQTLTSDGIYCPRIFTCFREVTCFYSDFLFLE